MVYEFLDQDGEIIGCGTEAELTLWTAEGVLNGVVLGAVIA